MRGRRLEHGRRGRGGLVSSAARPDGHSAEGDASMLPDAGQGDQCEEECERRACADRRVVPVEALTRHERRGGCELRRGECRARTSARSSGPPPPFPDRCRGTARWRPAPWMRRVPGHEPQHGRPVAPPPYARRCRGSARSRPAMSRWCWSPTHRSPGTLRLRRPARPPPPIVEPAPS